MTNIELAIKLILEIVGRSMTYMVLAAAFGIPLYILTIRFLRRKGGDW